jgi:hippurate hydrolase
VNTASNPAAVILDNLPDVRTWQEDLYRDLHQHPELSHQEQRTAGVVVEKFREWDYEIHDGIGGTGVVGIMRNGAGPTALMRADMDALPVLEATGLPYASTARAKDAAGDDLPVMHACGHDIHVACLLGAAALFAQAARRDGAAVTMRPSGPQRRCIFSAGSHTKPPLSAACNERVVVGHDSSNRAEPWARKA